MPNAKHARYLPPEGTIAFLRPVGERIGRVRDIGLDGLTFEYLVMEPHEVIKMGVCTAEIDVFCLNREGIHLPSITCRVLWERDLFQNLECGTSYPMFRRVGIQFFILTLLERCRLNNFLAVCRPMTNTQHPITSNQ